MVSRLVLFKMKGKSWIFILVGVENAKTTKRFDEISQILIPGALNDTKKIRKASADIFANVGPEKPNKYSKTRQNRKTNPNKSNKSATVPAVRAAQGGGAEIKMFGPKIGRGPCNPAPII